MEIMAFLIAPIVILIVVFAVCRTGLKPNGNILLGVTLPNDVLKHDDALNIVKKYKKTCNLYVLVFLILLIPVVFLAEYFSILHLYFIIWSVTLFYLTEKIFVKHFDKLYALKRKNQWWVGCKNIISIDTEVSRLKNTFMVPDKWFILPFAVSIIIAVIAAYSNNLGIDAIIVSITGIIMVAIFYGVFFAIGKTKTKVYSTSTDVNITLNHVFKREWSRCMLIGAVASSIYMGVLLFLNPVTVIIITYVFIAAIVIPGAIAFSRMRNARNKLMQYVDKDVYTDDDQYFRGLLYYNNPRDNSVFIEKRMGYGLNINIATLGGKIIFYGVGGLGIAIWVGVAVLLVYLDFFI